MQTQLKASGRLHLTNKRLTFISDNATRLPDPSLPPSYELRTLSVPLNRFQDGRFLQPWLAANYYEAVIIPVQGGGFDESQLVKFSFREGRGFEFSQVVEEVSRRFLEETGGQTDDPQSESLRQPVLSCARSIMYTG